LKILAAFGLGQGPHKKPPCFWPSHLWPPGTNFWPPDTNVWPPETDFGHQKSISLHRKSSPPRPKSISPPREIHFPHFPLMGNTFPPTQRPFPTFPPGEIHFPPGEIHFPLGEIHFLPTRSRFHSAGDPCPPPPPRGNPLPTGETQLWWAKLLNNEFVSQGGCFLLASPNYAMNLLNFLGGVML